MADQVTKRRRGRPRSDDARINAERQALYGKARAHDMAEVAYAKDALTAKGTQKAFITAYRGTPSGTRLRRGLARLLADDPVAMAFFFDELISSCDKK